MAVETSWVVTYTPVGGSSTTANLPATNQWDADRHARAYLEELVRLGKITGVTTAAIVSNNSRSLPVKFPAPPPPVSLY